MDTEHKKLYRSRKNRIFLGILGGLGAYFNTDPVLYRLIFVVLFVATGLVPFGLAYLLAYFVVPLEPENNPPTN